MEKAKTKEYEMTIIQYHCRLHGREISDGLYELKNRRVGAEFLAYLDRNGIGYVSKSDHYIIALK